MVDPITLEIVRNQLLAAADDMRVGMVRSAFTPIIYEAGDCAVALLDEHADVLAQSSGLPMFLGNLEQAVKASVELRGGPTRFATATPSASTTPTSRAPTWST